MRKSFLAMAIGLAMVLSAGTAFGWMASDTGDYTVVLGNTCTIDASGATTNFGTYPLLDPDLIGVAAGSISVTCTTGLNYEVGAGGGLNYNQSAWAPGLPAMHDGAGNYVAYLLFQGGFPLGDNSLPGIDPGYVSTQPNDPGFPGTGNNIAQVYNLSADVLISDPALVDGIYTDTVTFTVVW